MAVSGRLYTISFSNVTMSAVQDALALFTSSSKVAAIHQVNLGQITGTTVANLRVRLRYMPATVTAGTSGVTAGTPNKTNPGDPTSGCTFGTNNTGQASTSGTAVDVYDDVWNTVNGFVWYPPIPGRPPVMAISTGFVVSIDTAPSSLVCNGSMTFEELP